MTLGCRRASRAYTSHSSSTSVVSRSSRAVYHDWRSLRDDELLAVPERDGFTTLVTTDKCMAGEQAQATIAIVAVDDNSLGGLLAAATSIANAIRSTLPGESRLVPVARVRR